MKWVDYQREESFSQLNLSARLQSVTLLEKENIDWEDIAVAVEDGISYIYVADTGNNHEPRCIE